MGSAFRVRLLMIEYFTVKFMGYGNDNYSFVAFKSIEQMIDDVVLWVNDIFVHRYLGSERKKKEWSK